MKIYMVCPITQGDHKQPFWQLSEPETEGERERCFTVSLMYCVQHRCCGSSNYTDWSRNRFLNETHSVPDSCCKNETQHCGHGVLMLKNATTIYTEVSTSHGRSCVTSTVHNRDAFRTFISTRISQLLTQECVSHFGSYKQLREIASKELFRYD